MCCCYSGRDSCMLPPAMHATLAALGTILSPIRSGPSSPALCLCEPRRPRGEMQAVPCGARSDTRLLPASGAQPRPAQTRSVRAYNPRLNVYFKVKTVLTFLGHVRLSRKKEAPAHPEAFARSWPSLGRRGARRPDSPLVHPGARTHGEIRGRNAPARFRHGASLLSSVRLMTPCHGGCALTYASARGVLCAHAK